MLHQSSDKNIKQIKRSLDRLDHFIAQQNMNLCIPVFYYSAQILQKYAKEVSFQEVDCSYFISFKKQLQIFAAKAYKLIKNENKQVLEEIFQIVNSQLFTNCMRPDIYESRNSKKHQILKQQKSTILRASQSYNFHIPQTILNEGISQFKTKSSIKQKNQESGNSFISINQKEKTLQGVEQQNKWDNIQIAYTDHNIDKTFKLLTEFVKKYPIQTFSEKRKDFKTTVQLQYNTMKQFYDFYDIKGWIFDKQEDGVKLQYILFEEQKQIAIRIQGIFQGKIENFLSIISEVDLMGDYVPFCYDARLVKQISRNQRIGTSKIYIPCLTDRQTYFYAAGYDRTQQTNSIFFYSKTVNDDEYHHKKYNYTIPKQSDYVRLQYKFFIIEYIPITKEKAKIRLASCVDLKLNFLPNFILSLSARKFAFNYFSNIIKINKNFAGSPWQIAIKKKPELYNFFKQKINKIFS